MSQSRGNLKPSQLAALAVLALAIGLLLVPGTDGGDRRVLQGAALTVFAMGFFATGAIPEFVTGLAFFALATLIAIAPNEVIFAGWSSTALWLTIGGLILGLAVNRTGLGARLAETLTRLFGPTYKDQIGAMVLVGVALSFLMPSTMGRIILLMPITLAIADRLGLQEGRTGRHGLVVAMAWSTWMPSASILPANVPNLVVAGVSETLYDLPMTYGSYLFLHFPVTGLLKALTIYILVRMMFRDEAEMSDETANGDKTPMSRDERVLAWVLGITLVLWAMDFLHGISPSWIALGAAVVCFLPGFRLIPTDDFNAKFNTASAIYIAAVLSVSAVVVDTGFGKWLGGALISHLPLAPDGGAMNFAALVGLGSLTGMLSTAPGVAAILGPFAQDMAQAADLPLMTVLMTMVVGYSTVILPYQVPPLVIALQLGRVPLAPAAKYSLVLALITFAFLTPINYLWWSFLGYM